MYERIDFSDVLLTIYERRKIYYDGYKRETDGNQRENLCSSILYSGKRSSDASATTLDVLN